jgi:hypothetical protein
MDKMIEQFLDTAYSGPLWIDSVSSGNNSFAYVMHGDEVILVGQVYNGSGFSYTTWGSPFEVFFRIHRYIPTEIDDIERVLVNWIRIKCESQRIPFAWVDRKSPNKSPF